MDRNILNWFQELFKSIGENTASSAETNVMPDSITLYQE